jgi:exonuclease SbcC
MCYSPLERRRVVPVRLTLRNFLCYRDPPADGPTVDFTGIQIACLTGENGNGKSALLDAMTWALWGQARARSDDELIHLGRTEMEVEFEFLAGEQTYRVIRKRKKGTQRTPGSTSLEFHIATDAGWRPLTANHVRDTEQLIKDVLKLDYETFVNSAFLLQGRADAFTVKTPAEILGLSQYDELEQQARYERGLRDDQVRTLEHDLATIEAALAHEPEYLSERAQTIEALAHLTGEITAVTQELDSLRQAARLLALQREQVSQAERRAAEAAAEVKRLQGAVAERQAEIARLSDLTSAADSIRAGYEALQAALAEDRALTTKLEQQAALERARAQASAELERARADLQAQEQLLAAEVSRLQQRAEGAGQLTARRATLEEEAAALAREEERLGALRLELQRLRDAATSLRTENAQLREQMEELKRKQTELSDATICPLCRTELGADGQAHIVAAYEQEGHKLAVLYRQKRSEIERYEGRAATAEQEIAGLEPRLRRTHAALARELGALETGLKEVEEAAGCLPARSEELTQLRRRLEAGDFAPQARERLERAQQEVAALDYRSEAHQAVRERIEALRPLEARARELDLAAARLEAVRTALKEAEQALADWRGRLEQSSAELERMRAELRETPDASARLQEVQARHDRLSERQRQYQQALGAVEQKLDDCRRMRQDQAVRSAALKTALEERRIYEELAAAFSKRGIQALIIDHVLPEITEEANRLLARMTNGRLQVMMDTQRQTQRGGVAETLDIRISDELGTRNYELFSGGEAFRVNLALRIALSKLLARRAGAPLPTLVIDEGFGSQDAGALERLVEAINVIQSDFRCLLIITHLTELKDQFPVQIAVSKTAEGSLATVLA